MAPLLAPGGMPVLVGWIRRRRLGVARGRRLMAHWDGPAPARLRPSWRCDMCGVERRYNDRQPRNVDAYRHKRDTGHPIWTGNKVEQLRASDGGMRWT